MVKALGGEVVSHYVLESTELVGWGLWGKESLGKVQKGRREAAGERQFKETRRVAKKLRIADFWCEEEDNYPSSALGRGVSDQSGQRLSRGRSQLRR